MNSRFHYFLQLLSSLFSINWMNFDFSILMWWYDTIVVYDFQNFEFMVWLSNIDVSAFYCGRIIVVCQCYDIMTNKGLILSLHGSWCGSMTLKWLISWPVLWYENYSCCFCHLLFVYWTTLFLVLHIHSLCIGSFKFIWSSYI